MDLDSLITFLGWATLTYSWLHINFTFAAAIGQAIKKHNIAMSQRGYRVGYENGKEDSLAMQEKENDDDEESDDDESET